MGVGVVLGQSRNAGGAPTTSTGKRTARFSIGTSTNGWTANDCDYLCDGTDDQVEINAAIQALPNGGGEIVILDGTYNISATILVNRDNVSLIGNGRNTQLKRNWNSSNDEGIVTLNANNCLVKNFYFYGSSGSYNHNVYIVNSSYCTVSNNYIYNNGTGILLNNSGYNIICINNLSPSILNGIILTNGSLSNIINNNVVQRIETKSNSNFNNISNNESIGGNSGIGIFSANNTITGNNFSNGYMGIHLWNNAINNLVSGNTFCDNDEDGISLSNYSSNNIIIGNICNNNARRGINCYLTSNNTVVGNSCFRGTGTSSDYTSTQYTIYINANSNNNLFACNNLLGKNYTTSGISTDNTFANNKY